MIRSKNALRDGNCFAQQRLGFFEAIYPHKGVRVVVGCNESSFMFFAVELQLRLLGEEDRDTLLAANNYAASLVQLKRFGEAKSLLLKRMPVARRVLGESDDLTIKMRWTYAKVTYKGDGATLSDLCEAVATLAETEQTARRVLGGAHPLTGDIGICLRQARAAQAATLEQEK